jgi:hypothetical protein
MPLLITDMQLDFAEVVSLVDKGASGDEETRPSIVLFKRRTKPMKIEKGMGVSQVVSALDELGLKPEQRDGVLKMMEAMMAPDAPAEEAPVAEEKADEEKPEGEAPAAPPVEEEAEKMDDEEKDMQKRADGIAKLEKKHAEEKAELAKRVKDLEDAAEMVKLEKRAAELEFLPCSGDETIDLLKKLGVDSEFLTKVNKAMEASPILRVAGVEGEGDATASATLEKRIKTMQDAEPKLTKGKAKAAIFKADPELFRAVKAEQQAN